MSLPLCLRLGQLVAVNLREVPFAALEPFLEGIAVADDSRAYHFAQQVVALAGAFAHAGEHGEAVVPLGDVVDELHDEHRLAHARAAEEAHLAALEVGAQQVDDLDAGVEHFLRHGQVLEAGRLAVDGVRALAAQRADAVDGFARDVEQAALDLVAHGHGDALPGGGGGHAARHAVGGVHGHGAHHVVADVLAHLGDEPVAVRPLDGECLVDGGHRAPGGLEGHVDDRPDDLRYMSNMFSHTFLCCFSFQSDAKLLKLCHDVVCMLAFFNGLGRNFNG